jgi:hypothetical protein
MNTKILLVCSLITFLCLLFTANKCFELKRDYEKQIYNIRTTYEFQISRMSVYEERGKSLGFIRSTCPIKPIMQISINPDGKSDTTYIYKLK